MKNRMKITAFLMGAVMAAGMISVPTYSMTEQNTALNTLLGDANGDGKVDVADATAIQQHLAGVKTLDKMAVRRSKVRGNTELSISDAADIHRYAAGLVSEFPVQNYQPYEEVTKVKDNITIYFKNTKDWEKVYAHVFNYSTEEKMSEWPGTEMELLETDDKGKNVYSMTVDVSKYDRVIFSDGTNMTTDTPINKASSGFYINSNKNYNGKYFACVYTYGQTGKGTIKTVTMDYPEGYEKNIYIWTPEGYDPADKTKKYSVVYMCDGQNLFGNLPTISGYEWTCDETVTSLMSNGGDGIIVVGIQSNDYYRYNELIPDLGNLAPEVLEEYGEEANELKRGCKILSDFIVDSVIPYVEKNYNTNSVRGIAGSSHGGIGAFYIGMENLDKFRFIC